MFLFLYGIYLGMELLSTARLFSKVTTLLPAAYKGSNFSTSSPTLVIISLFKLQSSYWVWTGICDLVVLKIIFLCLYISVNEYVLVKFQISDTALGLLILCKLEISDPSTIFATQSKLLVFLGFNKGEINCLCFNLGFDYFAILEIFYTSIYM